MIRCDRVQLGRALQARVEEIIGVLDAENPSSDPFVVAIFDEAARVSTTAVADWIAGGALDNARLAGARTTAAFGRLAAQHGERLPDVVKRTLVWRDTVKAMLSREAERLATPHEALTEAISMLERSTDVTLVRLAQSYARERESIDLELQRQEATMAFQATHDALTGLANRSLVVDRLDLALARPSRTGTEVLAVFVDLDNFKNINDSYGHDVGDELLCAVADRFRSVVHETDTLGRLGGDEFIVIAERPLDETADHGIVAQLEESLRAPFDIGDLGHTKLTVTASIGIAAGGDHSASDVLRHADLAMYRAKSAGRNQNKTFEADMATQARRRLQLEQDLRRAIDSREFFAVYQPIVDLATMQTVAVEALARWHHPEHGQVSPAVFIPALEEIGLIDKLGAMILEQACRAGTRWHLAGHPIEVAVNVSALQLDSAHFVTDLTNTLTRTGFPARSLIVEVTESALGTHPEQAVQHLNHLRSLGIGLAIDDFGTGYSSLDQLRRFPIDTLKIDRSFVDRMLDDTSGEALIASLIGLAQALDLNVLAEGIETNAQLVHLQAQSCNQGQGFLFARPLPEHEATQHLELNSREPAVVDRARASATAPTVQLDISRGDALGLCHTLQMVDDAVGSEAI